MAERLGVAVWPTDAAAVAVWLRAARAILTMWRRCTTRRADSTGLLRLAEAWHRRVMADEVVSHAFSHGFHPDHTERLAAYWAEALGGPRLYTGVYGDETSVVRMHSGNGPHEEMDRRAIACFDQALDDVGLDEREPLRAGAARLLRLGDHHDDGALPRVRRRRARRPAAPALEPGRGAQLTAAVWPTPMIVVGELAAVQGEPVDPGGCCLVDRAKAAAVMRPARVNAATASL